jgi:glycosyltransferase involved in cell wall biosynthesis
MTVYDIAPILFPEFCDYGLARWFKDTYIPSIGKYVNHAVCISRNTAMDLLEYPVTQGIGKISYLQLPFELTQEASPPTQIGRKLGITDHDYLIFLGSLEPRKNFEALLDGFETFRKLSPASKTKLVLVGATGWKNDRIEGRMRNSPYSEDLIRAGYLSDLELGELIEKALALAMVSHYEGYGLPVAQAFSKRTPVITTLGSSLPEACLGEAIFVESSDPWSIAAGIQQILQLKKDQIEDSSQYRVPWTWEKYARRLLTSVTEN